MDTIFNMLFPQDLFGRAYASHEEYLVDLLKKNMLLISSYLSSLGSSMQQPLDKFKWMVITPGQVRAALEDAPELKKAKEQTLYRMGKADFYIKSRLEKPLEKGEFFAVEYLKEVLKLSELELFCLLLALMPRYDERFSKVFAFLQDEAGRTTPDYDLMLKLWHFEKDANKIPGYHKMRRSLQKKAEMAFFVPGHVDLDNRLCEFILQNGSTDLELNGATTCLPGKVGPLTVMEEEAASLATLISDDVSSEALYICLKAAGGCGRRTRVRRVAELLETPVIFFDCRVSSEMKREEFLAALYTLGREAVLVQGMLALTNFDALIEELATAKMVLSVAGMFSGVVFVLCGEDTVMATLSENLRWIEFEIPIPAKAQSIALWTHYLDGLPLTEQVLPSEMANKFSFTPGQIAGTVQTAHRLVLYNGGVSVRQLTEAAYQQVSHKLKEHATLIYAKHTWDQLVLGESEKEMLKNACDQVRFKHIVYEKWGFDKRISYGKGISMLFVGPPGTGKTMAAQVVANDLGIEMYKVDLSQVVSKYIGETEKNLNQVFTEAKKSNAILLFDETDAILGKRTEVKDSHDKNANLETAYLLQKMEEYDGITVMTTNYKENIDSAFFRRISYVIHFTFPDTAARQCIWDGIYPKETPMDVDVDFGYLASQFEITGGSIKNIALVSAFMAAKEDGKVEMRHIIKAAKYELEKQGKIMLRDDYGEYGYLLR